MLTMENTFTEYPDIVSPKQMLHIGRNKAFEFLKGDIGNTAVGKRDMARIDGNQQYLRRVRLFTKCCR